MSSPSTDLIAFLGGLIPAVIWLLFWLLEDRCKPEPKWRLFLTFVAGMLSVALVLPLEKVAAIPLLKFGMPLLLVGWAGIEELFKLGSAYVMGLRSRAYDEPIDAVVYLVTAALGFSAAENALFLLDPLEQSGVVQTVLTGDLRFVGATLLHTLASATVGLFIAFSYYRSRAAKKWAALFGVILAVALHALFNLLILQADGAMTFSVFISIWVGIVAVLFLIERVKSMTKLHAGAAPRS